VWPVHGVQFCKRLVAFSVVLLQSLHASPFDPDTEPERSGYVASRRP
jgi:hypothetical protein